MKPLVWGVGINDADYATQKFEIVGYVGGKKKQKRVWICPYYRTWKHMLERAYSKSWKKKYPSYIKCSSSEEWKRFSNFKKWMEKQDWEGRELDKDLLFEGNKVYSEETCVFVSRVVNNFVTDSKAARGEWLIGVNWNKGSGKFISRCSNPFTKEREYLGYFVCEQEAHKAWLKRKLELAHQLAAIQTDERVAEALISRYANYVN